MSRMIYEQKLDSIIQELSDFKEHHFGGLQTMLRVGRKKPFNSEDEFIALLKKLRKDGYVDVNFELKTVVLTVDGRVFIGYEKRRALEEADIINASRTSAQERIYRRRLLWATWSAGIAAALLLLWQVWIWVYPLRKDFVRRNDQRPAAEKNK